MRTEEKKREALRLKEVKNSPPITPVEQVAVPIEDAAPAALNNEPTSEGQDDNNKEETPSAAQINDASANPENVEEPYQAEQDIPQPSIEVWILPISQFNTTANPGLGDCPWSRVD